MTKPQSSESRKAIWAAISSALAKRPSGAAGRAHRRERRLLAAGALHQLLEEGHAVPDRRLDPAGRDRIDPDPSRPAFLGGDPGELDHRRLRRAISGDAGLGLDPGDRGGEDDRAAAGRRLDRAHRRLQRQEGAVEIGRPSPAAIPRSWYRRSAPPAPMPALTRAWVRPVRSAAAHISSSATSPIISWRSQGREKAKSRSCSSSRSTRISLRAPPAASRVAVAAPMPEAAPVIEMAPEIGHSR